MLGFYQRNSSFSRDGMQEKAEEVSMQTCIVLRMQCPPQVRKLGAWSHIKVLLGDSLETFEGWALAGRSEF